MKSSVRFHEMCVNYSMFMNENHELYTTQVVDDATELLEFLG